MLLVHHADHLFSPYFERGAGGNGSDRGQTRSSHCRERLFSNKVTGREKRDGGFLPGCGNNRDLCAAFLKVEDGIRRASLRKKGLIGANWTILRPRPALARKAAVSNPGFSSSSIEGPPSDCGPCRTTTGGARSYRAFSVPGGGSTSAFIGSPQMGAAE